MTGKVLEIYDLDVAVTPTLTSPEGQADEEHPFSWEETLDEPDDPFLTSSRPDAA